MARIGLFDATLRHEALFDPDLVVSEGWFDADLIAAGGPQTYIYAGVIATQSTIIAAWRVTWNPAAVIEAQSGIIGSSRRVYAFGGLISGLAGILTEVRWQPAPPAPLQYPLMAFARPLRPRFIYRCSGRIIISPVRVEAKVAFVHGSAGLVRMRRPVPRHRHAVIACPRGHVLAQHVRPVASTRFRSVDDDDVVLLLLEE